MGVNLARKNAVQLLVGSIAVALIAAGLACQQNRRAVTTQAEADRLGAIYLQARNTVNLDLLDQVYDPAVLVHDCSVPADIRGLDALKAYYRESHEGFPDFRMELGDTFVSGDKIVFRWTVTGTHTGRLRGLPPTGKAVRFSGVAVDRVVDGKIVEEWVDFNVLDLLQQLGFSVAPPAEAPAP